VRTTAASAPLLILLAPALIDCGPTMPASGSSPSGSAASASPTAKADDDEADPLETVTRIMIRSEIVNFGDEVAWAVDGFGYRDDANADADAHAVTTMDWCTSVEAQLDPTPVTAEELGEDPAVWGDPLGADRPHLDRHARQLAVDHLPHGARGTAHVQRRERHLPDRPLALARVARRPPAAAAGWLGFATLAVAAVAIALQLFS